MGFPNSASRGASENSIGQECPTDERGDTSAQHALNPTGEDDPNGRTIETEQLPNRPDTSLCETFRPQQQTPRTDTTGHPSACAVAAEREPAASPASNSPLGKEPADGAWRESNHSPPLGGRPANRECVDHAASNRRNWLTRWTPSRTARSEPARLPAAISQQRPTRGVS